jgi:hypothetical protein
VHRKGRTFVVFEEHEHAHGRTQRDNNMRAAVIHVIADAAVSVLVIEACGQDYYRPKLARFRSLSDLTIAVHRV